MLFSRLFSFVNYAATLYKFPSPDLNPTETDQNTEIILRQMSANMKRAESHILFLQN